MSDTTSPFVGAPETNSVSRVKHKASNSTEARKRDLDGVLARIGPANRALVDAYLLERCGELKVSSRGHIARAFLALDRHGGHVALTDLPAREFSRYFHQAVDTKSPATLWGEAAVLRGFFNHRTGRKIPADLWQALRRKSVPLKWVTPLTPEEFGSLLNAAQGEWTAPVTTPGKPDKTRRTSPLHRVKLQALLWTLWDSGFRIGELLAMRVGGVEFKGDGTAALTLPPPQDGLKTGQRCVPVVDCAGPLQAWLELHPHADKPWMPLFPSDRADATEPYWPTSVNQMLTQLGHKAGLRRHANPHLFRHTRATRAALAGWNEALMRKFFGWSATSDMPAHYIHFVQQDVWDRVRKDAGMDAQGHRKTENVGVGGSDVMLELLKASQENALRQTELMERLAQGLPPVHKPLRADDE